MKRINIGVVGLGRLGKSHAENLVYKTAGANVTAACSVVPEELEYAKNSLGINENYGDFDEFLSNSNIDAVWITSSTSVHAEQIIKSIHAGKHVFCEKPVAINVADCLRVEEAAASKPELVVCIGFVRRYDASYADAKQKIDAGLIGKPFCVRSQSADMDKFAEFQVEFTKSSGGFFLDIMVHDIDLARWLLSSEISTGYALGGCYKHQGFEQYQDADNAGALFSMENGTTAYLSGSRTMMHGHDTFTEVLGTEGVLTIGCNPRVNRVEIRDSHGLRNECVETFYDRFEDAFLEEARDFIHCIQNKLTPRVSVRDATENTRAAIAVTDSYRKGQVVNITDY